MDSNLKKELLTPEQLWQMRKTYKLTQTQFISEFNKWMEIEAFSENGNSPKRQMSSFENGKSAMGPCVQKCFADFGEHLESVAKSGTDS